jgi:hypothetical protein
MMRRLTILKPGEKKHWSSFVQDNLLMEATRLIIKIISKLCYSA